MDYATILTTITPAPEEVAALQIVISTMAAKLSKAAERVGVAVEVVPGGSTAKGTYLAGNFDIDMFVRFKTDQKNLSDLLELMLADLEITFERVHGSRDYFTFTQNNYFFEIVPVKYVDTHQDVDNVTDMSPLHVFWAQKHLTPSLRNDIRLAKQFCKAIQVYGAESYINGISGHVLDILVIHYGGFEKLLHAAASWGERTIIDSENKHANVLTELNKAKLVSPLVVIDPIDPQRNASAALSLEKYNLFKKHAKAFLVQPEKKYFDLPRFDKALLEKKKRDEEDLYVIKFTPQQGKKDVVITKVLKVFEFLHRHLQLYDFKVNLADWFVDTDFCYVYFFVDNNQLSETLEREGPPLENFQGVERFKEVHGDAVYEKDNRLYVRVRRDFIDAGMCLRHLLQNEFVAERVTDYTFN
ncbi:CCA tRNA nucleotidyltransferase [Candidatus Woesearchaeota archaeon]|nr:CCA tRNA nucleotidyltransferase [Candidatus Woesearchaeota archaeon]